MQANLRENKKYLLWIITVFLVLSIILILDGYLYYKNQSKKIKVDIHKLLSAFAQLKENQLVVWRAERMAGYSSGEP